MVREVDFGAEKRRKTDDIVSRFAGFYSSDVFKKFGGFFSPVFLVKKPEVFFAVVICHKIILPKISNFALLTGEGFFYII